MKFNGDKHTPRRVRGASLERRTTGEFTDERTAVDFFVEERAQIGASWLRRAGAVPVALESIGDDTTVPSLRGLEAAKPSTVVFASEMRLRIPAKPHTQLRRAPAPHPTDPEERPTRIVSPSAIEPLRAQMRGRRVTGVWAGLSWRTSVLSVAAFVASFAGLSGILHAAPGASSSHSNPRPIPTSAATTGAAPALRPATTAGGEGSAPVAVESDDLAAAEAVLSALQAAHPSDPAYREAARVLRERGGAHGTRTAP